MLICVHSEDNAIAHCSPDAELPEEVVNKQLTRCNAYYVMFLHIDHALLVNGAQVRRKPIDDRVALYIARPVTRRVLE